MNENKIVQEGVPLSGVAPLTSPGPAQEAGRVPVEELKAESVTGSLAKKPDEPIKPNTEPTPPST